MYSAYKRSHYLSTNTIADVILVSPGWTTYAPQVKLAGKNPLIVQTSLDSEWKMTPEMLRDHVAKWTGSGNLSQNRLMILNTPGNPCKLCLPDKCRT